MLERSNYAFNYRIVIEYDGRHFHGWQKQHGLKTVQSELEIAIRTVLRSDDISPLQSAGRTDAGVHARGQVVNFRTNAPFDKVLLKHAVSSILRGHVAVLDVAEVPASFNALHSAIARQYSYQILHRPAPAVLDRGRVWHVTSALDIDRMKREATALIGKKDFSSFRGSGCVSNSPIKEIFESEIIVDGQYVIYRVIGKGFLKHMVRNIVGTLVGMGKGTLELPSMEALLEMKDRRVAGVTAPAYGLCLDYVKYADFSSFS